MENLEAVYNDLKQLGLTSANSNASKGMTNAIRRFQSFAIGPNGMPLTVDGKAGPLTLFALDAFLKRGPNPTPLNINHSTNYPPIPKSETTGVKALKQAINEIGKGETVADNRGPDIARYCTVTGAAQGKSWCASFISYCFQIANGDDMPFNPTAGARDILDQLKLAGLAVKPTPNDPPRPGDIVVWWRKNIRSWEGHVGIVYGYRAGVIATIEGNRGAFPSKVAYFQYTMGQISQLLGFARTP